MIPHININHFPLSSILYLLPFLCFTWNILYNPIQSNLYQSRFPIFLLPISCLISSSIFHFHHFPCFLRPTHYRSYPFQFRFRSHLLSFSILPYFAINSISYHISYNIFCYLIPLHNIPILSHIVTITTHIVFNTTYNPTHIPYHVFNYYFISLLITYLPIIPIG